MGTALESDPVTIWESMFVDRDGMNPLIGETIHKWVPNIPVNICVGTISIAAKAAKRMSG